MDAILKNISNNGRISLIQNVEDQVERIIDIVNNRKENTEDYKTLVNNLYELLRTDETAQQILLSTLIYNVSTTKDREKINANDTEEFDAESYYLSGDDADAYDSEYDAVQDYYKTDSFFDYYELQRKDYVSAYRYVRKYLIPKNRVLSRLSADPATSNYKLDLLKLQEILKSTKEQQILGAIYGINQGMDTGDYE